MGDNLKRTATWNRFELASDNAVADLLERLPLPIAVLDRSGETVLLNGRFHQKYPELMLRSRPVQEALHEHGSGWKTLRIPRGESHEAICRVQTVDLPTGSMLIFDDATDGAVLRQLDQLHAQVSALQRLCSTDVVTGAWNRSHFERIFAAELERSVVCRQPLSLVLIDIDHFKDINDTHGHQSGDAVLCELVSVIRDSIRSMDTLFRWGGDEFVVISASTGYRGAAALAEKVRKAVETHSFRIAGSVTASLGAAEHLVSESAETWFRRLDEALYRAKEGGRNRVWVERRGSSDLWLADRRPSVVRLVWQEAYECGEPNIDAQHRELFAQANVAFDASFDTSATRARFQSAIDRLVALVVSHFAYEEEALGARRYDDLSRHKAAHACLLAQAVQLRTAAATGKITTGDLVDFVAGKVVAQHLFAADMKFFPLFANASPAEEAGSSE